MKPRPNSNLADSPSSLRRAEETKLSLGIQVAGVALGDVDYATGLHHLSAEAVRLFGLGSVAMTFPRAIVHGTFHPDDVADILPRIAESQDPAGKGWFAMDHRIVWPNGEVRWLRVRKQVFFDGPTNALRPAHAAFAAIDVTDDHNATAQINRSEVRYRRLFEAAHDGVLLIDPATNKITDANPFMTSLLGYSKDQLVGKELFEIGLVKDETYSRTAFAKLKTDHEIRYENLPLQNSHGQHQEVEVVANLYDEGGHNVIQCNIRDITVRKHAETILLRSKTLFTSLINQAPVGVYVVDSQFRLQQINPMAMPHFERITPLIGRDFAEIVRLLWPKKVASDIIKHFRHTLKTGESYQAPDLSTKRNDVGDKKSYEWSLQRVELPGADFGVVCFFNDITERNAESAALRHLAVAKALNERLKRDIVQQRVTSDALAASQLLTNKLLKESHSMRLAQQHLTRRLITAQEDERKRISRDLHDVIAQSLTGINLSLAGLLSHPDAIPPDLRKKLTLTQHLIEQSVDTVHRFARDLRPAMLDDLGIIPSLQAYTDEFSKHKRITVTLTAEPSVEILNSASRTVLYRVAQEALTNIAHHSHATRADIRLQLVNSLVQMEIQDNGSGFAVNGSSCKHKPNRLGLLGMKERVEMVGGQLSIDSSPGCPTTIRVELPTQITHPPLSSTSS